MRRIFTIALIGTMLLAGVVATAGCDGAAEEEKVALTFMQFYDPECPHCQAMEPTVEDLRDEYESRLEGFVIIDVSTQEGRDQAEEFGVFMTPTFFLLDADDEILDKISGAATKENMIKFIERGISDVQGESTGVREEIETEGGTEQDF